MKVTSLKDVETYLYCSVLAPLKGLSIDLDVKSPIKGNKGGCWSFGVEREELRRNRRRDYQRRRDRSNAKTLVYLYTNTEGHVVADYDSKRHTVRLYRQPFDELKAIPIMGKLHQMFLDNTPFTKVTVKKVRQQPRPALRGNGDSVYGPSDIDVEEGYEEEDL